MSIASYIRSLSFEKERINENVYQNRWYVSAPKNDGLNRTASTSTTARNELDHK